jgi:RNA polymerase sigma factor (sigma-70 family)
VLVAISAVRPGGCPQIDEGFRNAKSIQYVTSLSVYQKKGAGCSLDTMGDDPKRNIGLADTFRQERRRLLDFIRRRVRSEEDAEDILQEVFYQLSVRYRLTEPIEQLSAWLFLVARNKIIDWYRKRKPGPSGESGDLGEDEDRAFSLEEMLPDPSGGPESAYARSLVWEELEEALGELPEAQRLVFVRHELEGRSFKEIAVETGEPVNTLLSRKRYALLFLRERLQELYDDFQQS